MTTPPDFDTIEVASEGPIGRLTLARPDKLNPLSTKTLRELADAAHHFDTQRDIRAVIVSGRGRAFSAGADISSFGQAASNDGLGPRDAAETGWLMARAMEQMRAVTIAAIWGPCVGGGLVLAGACDFRIAAVDTYFSIPEVDLGIPLAWGGIPRLVREIAAEEGLSFKLAVIHAEQDKSWIKDQLSQGKVRPMRSAPDLAAGDIERAERIVGCMGAEPYMAALDAGAQVVLGGRSTAPAPFAAAAMRAQMNAGPAG